MTDYFIDYTATYDGDGTAPAQAAGAGLVGAWNKISGNWSGWVDGDTVWLRRHTNTSYYDVDQITHDQGVRIIGWPISDDIFYSERPASGTAAGWDADIAEYALIRFNATNDQFYCNTTYKWIGNIFSRLKLFSNYSNEYSVEITNTLCTDIVFYDVYFDSNNVAANENTVNNVGVNVRFINCTFKNYILENGDYSFYLGCTWISSPATTVNIYQNNGSTYSYLVDCVFSKKDLTSSINTAAFNSYNTIYNYFDCIKIENAGLSCEYFITNTNGNGYLTTIGVTGDANSNIALPTFTKQNALFQVYGGNITSLSLGTSTNCFIDVSGSNLNIATPIAATLKTCFMFLENCTGTTPPIGTLGSGSQIQNVNMNTDQLKISGNGLDVQSGSVSRTGGAQWSIQIINSFYSSVGNPKFDKYFMKADIVAGTSTFTLYGCHALFTSEVRSSNIWFDVHYIDSAGIPQMASCLSGAPLTTDASVWTEPNPYTGFKLEVPVTITADQTVKIYISHIFLDPAGYINLDPSITIAI